MKKYCITAFGAAVVGCALMIGCGATAVDPGGSDNGVRNAELSRVPPLSKRHHPVLRHGQPIQAFKPAGVVADAKNSNTVSALAPDLTYRGGPLLQSAKVQVVLWGDGVDPVTTGHIGELYQSISGPAPYIHMLSEYNINGYTVGSVSFLGQSVDPDAPLPTNGGINGATGTITDDQIRAEVARQIDLGRVAAPDDNTIYMVYFPPGFIIDMGGGSLSCQVFCAYHNSFRRNGVSVFYGVMPDLNGLGCEQGCGLHPDAFSNLTSASTHELVEAITDAEVGENNLAWVDDNFSEIGDICVDWDGMAGSSVVQSEWSDEDHGCRSTGPNQGSAVVSATFNGKAIADPQHNTLTYHISAQLSGLTKPLTLSTPELPSAWLTFNPPALDAKHTTSTLTVKVPRGANNVPLRAFNRAFNITALDSNGTFHFVQAQAPFRGLPPVGVQVAPAQGPTSGNNGVVLTTSNVNGLSRIDTVTVDGLAVPINEGADAAGNPVFFVIMPGHAAGAVPVVVTNPLDPKHPATTSYTFAAAGAVRPTITSVTPSAVPNAGSAAITIRGTNFNFSPNSPAAMHVTIGGVAYTSFAGGNFGPGNFFVNDDQTIVVNTLPRAPGPVDVVVTNGDGSSATRAGGLAYTDKTNPAPFVDRLSVDHGDLGGGTYVILFGGVFTRTPATLTVRFGGQAAEVVTVSPKLDLFSDGFIGVRTPAAAAHGAVDVSVTDDEGQTVTLRNAFTY